MTDRERELVKYSPSLSFEDLEEARKNPPELKITSLKTVFKRKKD